MGENYNKRLKYMDHYQLERLMKVNKNEMPIYSSLVIMTILSFFIPYPDWLKAHDVAIAFCFSFFYFILKPMFYKGEIKAYYRREYKVKDVGPLRNLNLLSIFSFSRIILLIVYFFLSKLDNRDVNLFNGVFNKITTPLTIIYAIYAIRRIYFSEKYISIRDYSNGVLYRQKELNMPYNLAVNDLMKAIDEELGISGYNGYQYDYEDKGIRNIGEEKSEKTISTTRRTSRINKI